MDEAASRNNGGVRTRQGVGPADERGRPAVMADVAALAGVSHMTVSRVINDHPSVRKETRSKVLAAMQQLDYRPNVAARALVTGRSRTLGVVGFDMNLYGPVSMLFGFEQAARANGYFVCVTSVRMLDRRSISEAVNRLRGQGVDGIVIDAPNAAATDALRYLPRDIPLVTAEGATSDGLPVVAVDQAAGATRVSEHLLSLGHGTVWHISGPQDWLVAQARTRAWRAVLEAAERHVPSPLVGDWSARSGYEAGKILARDGDVTAIFASNDQMALGVLRALREAGRDVPGDVSVVGFDDVPEAAYFPPPLTTVRQDFTEVGRRGLELLLSQIGGATRTGVEVTVEAELVVRASSGAVRRR